MNSSKSRSVQPRLQERRRKRRVNVTPLIYLTVWPNNGGLLVDLSEAGMCVELANPLAISEEIHFSFSPLESQVTEGVGRVCWVSDSGRRAGVQLVECSGKSLEQIMEWLGGEVTEREETNPQVRREEFKNSKAHTVGRSEFGYGVDADNKRCPGSRNGIGQENHAELGPSSAERGAPLSFTYFDSPALSADAASQKQTPAPTVPRHEGGLRFPDSPLFFLPQKKEESEDIFPYSFKEETKSAFTEGADEKTGCDSSALRSAVLSRSVDEKTEQGSKSGFGKTAVRTVLLLALLALCFAIYRYEGTFLGFEIKGLAPVANEVFASPGARMAKRRRIIHRGIPSVRRSDKARQVESSGNVLTFRAPGADGVSAPFPGLPRALSQSAGAGSPANEPTFAGAGGSAKSFSFGDDTSNRVAATSLLGSNSTVKFIGLMATLHNDGALVDEGGFTSFSPHRNDPTSVLERIVLDVMVGKNGEVKAVRLISSPDSKLAKAVMLSVKKWHYRPLYERGEAVEFATRLTLDFSKPSHNPE